MQQNETKNQISLGGMEMETLKAKFIKIEIDGTMYEGFLQEVKEAAAETATPDEKFTFGVSKWGDGSKWS
jgi:hypothetical protein